MNRSGVGLNRDGPPPVHPGMWDDRRLLNAIAALPPEALIEGPPEDAELLWRRAVRRLRGDRAPAPAADHVADAVALPVPRPAD